ncbi:MAG: hypothetical protein ACTHK4_13475 [Mycobacteriales bacterium]
MPGSHLDMVEMALMGLDTSLVAPAVLYASRSWPGWTALTLPAVVALPVFLVVHAALTVWMTLSMPTLAGDIGFQAALIVVSFVFWLPVLAPERRLSDAGRSVYLFLAMPTMDLAGVFVVLHGDSPGGLAMIVAMLPVGLVAVFLTWRWISNESEICDAAGSRRGSIALR